MSRIDTIAVLLAVLSLSSIASAQEDERYNPDRALEISQAALGNTIGNYELIDSLGASIRLRDDYAGRPLVISMIFTSCHHVCPATTKHLATAVDAAREALGADSFDVVTIGFDTAHDTPEAMGAFARRQRVNKAGWRFLSADQATIAQISNDLGFIFFPTARGFDHLNQSTIINRDGVVYSQVYGVTFELPWLVEPLKELVFNRPGSAGHLVAGLVDRIKLFCTVYDPTTGRYRFDNSLFVRAAAGLTFILGLLIYLTREIIIARRSNKHE
ncbi:MAG: SCO family protein [Gammaproteobacteria bacterium]|nr:SCO family protein [Gammaproteobacteria bacterium]